MNLEIAFLARSFLNVYLSDNSDLSQSGRNGQKRVNVELVNSIEAVLIFGYSILKREVDPIDIVKARNRGFIMRALLKLSAVVAAFAAVPAFAVPVITSAAVTGSNGHAATGTVWNTASNQYYSLFVSHPYGNTLNPNGTFTSAPVGSIGDSNYTIAGDGWPTNTKKGNSDPFYDLTVVLTENGVSKTLTGIFDEATQAFTPTGNAVKFSGVNYSLTDFNWVRGLSNIVGSHSVGSAVYKGQPIGSKSDYQGAFTINAAGVPEPATWSLMIVGFGAVGGTMRRRRNAALAAA